MLPGIIWHTWSSVGEQEEASPEREGGRERRAARGREKRARILNTGVTTSGSGGLGRGEVTSILASHQRHGEGTFQRDEDRHLSAFREPHSVAVFLLARERTKECNLIHTFLFVCLGPRGLCQSKHR